MLSDVTQPVIVVGVDGSPGSVEALRWAAGQAALIGATVHALTAWQLPDMYSYTSRDFTAEASRTLSDAIEQALGAKPHVPIIAKVVEERPAVALIQAAAEAQLLVVGSRGRGVFAGMLLGSVSHHCASHAPCTVVVVRQPHGAQPDLKPPDTNETEDAQ